MAMDKSRTSPLMKTMIVLLAVTFVAGIGFAGVAGLSSCSANAPLLPGGGSVTGTGSTDTTAQINAINARFTPTVTAREASITANPKDYNLLVAQANDYYDWALQVTQVAKQVTPDSTQIWAAAASYYGRALDVKPGDPNVATDYSIALFYSGETNKAIEVAEKTRTDNPTFAPVVYNLGVFYANSTAADSKTKAVAAFNDYLKLEPNGANAANAKQFLKDLGGSATTTGTP